MTSLLCLVLAQNSPAIARFASFVKSHPAVSVRFTAEVDDVKGGSGTLMYERPRRILYTLKWGVSTYSLSSTEARYVEMVPSNRVYDEYPPVESLRLYPSRISGLPMELFPGYFLSADLSRTFKPGKFDEKGNDIHTRLENQKGKMDVTFTIDQQGHLTKIARDFFDGIHRSKIVWKFYDFQTPAKFSLAKFAVKVPLGYMPYAIPELATPAQKGTPVPMTGWKTSAGNPFDLAAQAAKKPFLLAFLDENSPSLAMRTSLDHLHAAVPSVIVGPGGLVDPNGAAAKKLGVPARPMVYLVGADGKVSALWMGFDRTQSTQFESDVKAALKE